MIYFPSILISSCRNRKEATQFHIGVAGHRPKDPNSSDAIRKESRMLRVSRIVTHPSYRPTLSKVTDDIALIQLDQEAEWNDLVQPTCLPNPDRNSYSGMMATVAGWGLTNEIQNGKPRARFL